MQFTARTLRVAVRSPAAAIKLLQEQFRHPVAGDTPRSPQRPMFDAALRVHFRAGREVGAMVAEFDCRWSKAKRRESAAATFANGRRMVEQFVVLDAGSPDPLRVLEPPRTEQILGHDLRLTHDLVYGALEGLVLRQLLTDSDMWRVEHLRLYALACLLHFEASSVAPLARVEIWQLRMRKTLSWPRFLLLRQGPLLAERLDTVARAFEADAA